MRDDSVTPRGNRFPPAGARDAIEARKRQFTRLAQSRHGWFTSLPGDKTVSFDCLPGSTLPDDLRGFGYDVRDDGKTERILHAAIVERFARRAGGELEPLTPGSTERVAPTVTHAGIVKTRRFGFILKPPRIAADDAKRDAVNVLRRDDVRAAVLTDKFNRMHRTFSR
jgi:hypothetical protein